jgi:SAM-dependent methyltransferase
MGKAGEIDYVKNLATDEVRHAVHKPFSDENCPFHLQNLGIILGLLPPRPARVLDLGCGTGWTSRFFARAGHDVVGADICADMIHHAEQMREREGLENLSFRIADYETLPFANEFDAVVFYDALHHAVDERLALRAAYEALRAGGLCIASEPGEGHSQAEGSRRAVERFGVTEKDMPPHHIVAVGREIGFRSWETFPYPHVNHLRPYLPGQPASPPRPGKNPLARLMHWFIRKRLRMRPHEYALLLHLRGRVSALANLDRSGGITCLWK